MGLPNSAIRLISAWQPRTRSRASPCDRRATNSSMSAPAINVSGLPDRSTAARISRSVPKRVRSASNSVRTPRVILLTGSPGRSSTTRAMPFATVTVNADTSAPLQHHGEAHAALRADRNEPELDVAAAHFVGQRRREPAPGGAERVPDGDGPTHHVERVPVDLGDRLGPAQMFLGPLPRL